LAARLSCGFGEGALSGGWRPDAGGVARPRRRLPTPRPPSSISFGQHMSGSPRQSAACDRLRFDRAPDRHLSPYSAPPFEEGFRSS
jgi:hypothetical protein